MHTHSELSSYKISHKSLQSVNSECRSLDDAMPTFSNWSLFLALSLLLFLPTATAVCGLSVGCDPPGPPSLWRVRGGVCWLLPGPGPLLRLGRQILYPLLRLAEEVSSKRVCLSLSVAHLSGTTTLINIMFSIMAILFHLSYLKIIIIIFTAHFQFVERSVVNLFLFGECWSDPSRRSRRQDVKYGNPIRQCRGYNSNGELTRIL